MCERKFICLMVLACFTIIVLIGCDPAIDEDVEEDTASAGINIASFEDNIIAIAPAAATIYKDGDPASVTIEAAKGYTCQWFVDGKLQGTKVSFTLDSSDFAIGDHFVTLIASKNKVPYSREFIITIVRQFN